MAKNSKKRKELEHYYGRSKYTPMYRDIFESEAYRSLSPKARCLLMELQYSEFPNRNGRLGFSEKYAAKRLGVSENTASKAFEELEDRGFILRNFDSDYTKGLAREWIITYLPYKGREPTDDWREYKKQKSDLKN